MDSIRAQIHRNAVALISIFIAVSSLGYNTWRNETSEAQRNIRSAAFRVLESLGELQEVVDYRFYYLPFETSAESEGQLRIRGYGSVALIRDLTMVMSQPATVAGQDLFTSWSENVNNLTALDGQGKHSKAAREAEQEITLAVNEARDAVLIVLKSLD